MIGTRFEVHCSSNYWSHSQNYWTTPPIITELTPFLYESPSALLCSLSSSCIQVKDPRARHQELLNYSPRSSYYWTHSPLYLVFFIHTSPQARAAAGKVKLCQSAAGTLGITEVTPTYCRSTVRELLYVVFYYMNQLLFPDRAARDLSW